MISLNVSGRLITISTSHTSSLSRERQGDFQAYDSRGFKHSLKLKKPSLLSVQENTGTSMFSVLKHPEKSLVTLHIEFQMLGSDCVRSV